MTDNPKQHDCKKHKQERSQRFCWICRKFTDYCQLCGRCWSCEKIIEYDPR